jgi:hydrogenase expression/formation protein HypC
MCLAVPARVVELREGCSARVDLGGLDLEVRTDLVPEVAAGQYVIVHAGYAIAVMDEQEAEETLRLIEEAHAPRKLPEH